MRVCDIVAEGFSPGVMERWGLGYETLRELRPDIIYAKQSGMGGRGAYGRMRAVGPIAAALAGHLRDVGHAGAGAAGRLGLLLPRLDRRLQLRARDPRRRVPPRADRRGPVDRRVADRGRHLHRRHGRARLVGERPRVVADRQPVAVQAGGARTASTALPARIAGSRSPASTTRSGGRSWR